MKTRILLPILAVLAVVGLTSCKPTDAPTGAGQKYHCPMHPTYVSDRMGDCPICNMKLVPIKEGGGTGTPAQTKPYLPKAGEYYCSMKCDGSITNRPGDCPVCGMKLLQADAPKAAQFAAEAADHHEPPPGRVVVAVTPEKRQLIGLRTAAVEPRDLVQHISATASVEHDETGFTRIAPRFNGWVKSLKVNYTGQEVEEGQVLFSVYSPDLLSSENEYLLAMRNLRLALTNRLDETEIEAARRLAASSRKRLELWQISAEEIEAVEKRGEVNDETVFRAPFTGHVLTKGKAFMAGESLYEIADLHRIWLRVAVYENDWPLVKTGQTAIINFPQLPGRSFTNTISFLYPHIDAQTRRGEARIEMANPGHILRPGMWANVHIEMPIGRHLTVPASAVIDTGLRQVVFIDRNDGHLEPREVKISAKAGDDWAVADGLKEGDRVVTRALFLIDSESQLKAAIAGMTAEAPASGAGSTNAASAHKH
jgi:RND family efflux transporter MFP subunit